MGVENRQYSAQAHKAGTPKVSVLPQIIQSGRGIQTSASQSGHNPGKPSSREWGRGRVTEKLLGIHSPYAFASGPCCSATSPLGTVALNWTPSHLPWCPEAGHFLGSAAPDCPWEGPREERGKVRRGKPLDGKESSHRPRYPQGPAEAPTQVQGMLRKTASSRELAGGQVTHRVMRAGLLLSLTLHSLFLLH